MPGDGDRAVDLHRNRNPDLNALAPLCKALKIGDNSLAGNKGFLRLLKAERASRFAIDEKLVASDERYDGLFVLRSGTDHDKETVANVYKTLWMVEGTFRTARSILEARRIYHKCDDPRTRALFVPGPLLEAGTGNPPAG